MTARLSEEQRAFQEAARRFARDRLAPRYQAREREGRVDRALVREMGALGLIGVECRKATAGSASPA